MSIRRRPTGRIAAILAGIAVSLAMLAPASAFAATSISLSPASGPAGTFVAVTGSGFPASVPGKLTFDGASMTSFRTSASGSFSVRFTVPSGAAAGSHLVRVTTNRGRVTATATFTVTTASPSPTPTPAPTATPVPTPTATPGPTATPAPTPTPTVAPGGDPVLLAAGDIASCSSSGDEATAAILAGYPNAVIAAIGDNAYQDNTAAEYANCYDPSWGRYKAQIRPVPGNHEYQTANAAGYFGYFGAAAGDPAKGYYAYDLGAWRIYALNSNCANVGGRTTAASEPASNCVKN